MLLRQPSTDPGIFTTAMPLSNATSSRTPSPQPPSRHDDHDNATNNNHTDDDNDLDDVWGSAPASPSSAPALTAGRSSPSRSTYPQHHPSDVPRLRQEHATAGYRDGIAAAKAASAQAGFDEGFGLGAVIGARAGRVLGVLEGLAAAAAAGGGGDEGRLATALAEEAGRELGVVSVFSGDYWDGEGVWRFEVEPGGREGGEAEIVFADVAGAHPLVRKWEAVLEGEARRWGVDLGILGGEEGVVRVGEEGASAKDDGRSVGNVKEKNALDW